MARDGHRAARLPPTLLLWMLIAFNSLQVLAAKLLSRLTMIAFAIKVTVFQSSGRNGCPGHLAVQFALVFASALIIKSQ
jgi:hypothetical protein